MDNFFPRKDDKLGWMSCIVGFLGGLLGFSIIIAEIVIRISN
jgi:hypothetical protein